MGCDIHPVVQVRESTDGGYYDWEVVAIPDRTRSYPFFAALAGVRDSWDHAPLAPHRGLPPDGRYQLDRFLSEEHSATWFALAEMSAHDAEWLKTASPGGDWPWQQWQRWLRIGRFYAQEYALPEDAVRFVMDFDS